jgi:hypothetical protein
VSNTTNGTRIEAKPETMNTLDGFVREGALRMLQAALYAEVQEYLDRLKGLLMAKDGVWS